MRLTWSMWPNLTIKTPEIGQLKLLCCLYFQLLEEICIINVVTMLIQNFTNHLIWGDLRK